MEKYSILMSVYKKDKPEFLRASIESMLRQTVAFDQFVIVKDGPLNEELDSVIDEYVNKSPNAFTVVPLEQNIGLGRALDKGLEHCRNNLVARMDADDIALPARCEKLLLLFEKNEQLGLAGTNIDEFYDEPEHIVSTRAVPSDYEGICRFARRRNPFNHPTVMFKKSEVIRCGGYGTRRRTQDFDLFSRMVNMGCYAENIDESLLLFRSNEGNYKRRKSWDSCKSYIAVVWANYKRGYCSLVDLAVVVCVRLVTYIVPMRVMKWLSDRFLRNKKSK